MPDPAPSTGVTPPEPGYLTTEFYVTILTLAMPAVTLIFRRDFSTQIQTWSFAAAGLASAIYSISRALRKSAADKSIAAAAVATSTNVATSTDGATGATSTATAAPTDTLSDLQAEKVSEGIDTISSALRLTSRDGTKANGGSTGRVVVLAGM